jgi:hypothetical protein
LQGFFRALLGLTGAQIAFYHFSLSSGWRNQASYQTQQRAFARAIGSDDAKCLFFIDGQRDSI